MNTLVDKIRHILAGVDPVRAARKAALRFWIQYPFQAEKMRIAAADDFPIKQTIK
ncbi:MAG: hypothetical protein ACK2UR_16320 [Candidatus Promineifilaceae bacterium]|jgi:hypothetical protein